MKQRPADDARRMFDTIWTAQFISFIGFEFAGLSTGIWVYLQTRSVLMFAVCYFTTVLPLLIVPLLIGPAIDRLGERRAILISEWGGGLSLMIIALLFTTDQIGLWPIYLSRVAVAGFSAAQRVGVTRSTQLLPGAPDAERAAERVRMGQQIGMTVSPLVCVALLITVGYAAACWAGFATYLVSVVLLTRLPMLRAPLTSVSTPQVSTEGPEGPGLGSGWRYIRQRPGLFGLLALFACMNVALGIVSVLLTPLVLSSFSVLTLGIVGCAASIGTIVGGLVAKSWAGLRQHMPALYGCILLQGCLLVVGGLYPTMAIVILIAFLFLFTATVTTSLGRAIWERKVPHTLQGPVASIRDTMGFSCLLIGCLVGPVAERILSGTGEATISLIAPIIIISGVLLLLSAIGGSLYPRLRRVEHELPDTSAVELPATPVLRFDTSP